MTELIVARPEWKAGEVSATITLAGRALGDRRHRVSWAASEGIGGETDFFLPLTLLPAMVTGSRLKLPGEVSPRLFSAVPEIQDIFRRWEEEYLLSPRRIPLGVEVRGERAGRASGVACFFSGGVDSFYTLLKNRDEVTHMIFVHGFDIALRNRSLREQASRAAREVARELGKSLIEVTTDLREFSDPLVHWGQYQGGALASVGLLFQNLFRKVLIPSTFTYAELLPWGSHPLLDPLWSTELTEFEHDGCEATRVDKVAYISEHESAMRWLRVCALDPETNDAYNCGRCEKCLMTMVCLRTAGTLGRCKTLPKDLDLEDIPNVSGRDGMAFARQNIKALERSGKDPELARALENAVQPPALYPNRRYRVANVLTNRTFQAPGAGKLVRPPVPRIRLREVYEAEEWDAAVEALGGGITQSWDWGLVYEGFVGWKTLRLLDERGRGGVQLLLKQRAGGFVEAYAPHGPLAADASDLPEITASAARRALECRAHLLKIEPRWRNGPDREMPGKGYARARGELPGSTLILDIPEDPGKHLEALPDDARFGVLHAYHQGVEVETHSRNSLDRRGIEGFLDLLEDTSRRQGFFFAPRAFYRELAMNITTARILLARHEGAPVAGALIATFGNEAYCFYGAFTSGEEELRALDLVQWEAMDVARRMGCSRYDMWGEPYRPYPGYWAWGFDPSKKRFGGTPVEYAGAYTRTLDHLRFWENKAIELGLKGYSALKKTPLGEPMKRLKSRFVY